MDMSSSIAELLARHPAFRQAFELNHEAYEAIAQNEVSAEVLAEVGELLKQTAAMWQRWYDLGQKIREEGRANASFIM
jgi:hypothetical protein